MHELSPGTVFAGHRIEAVIGRGGMGVVHRARQLDLDRVVALKVIAPELLEEESMRARFLREARAAAAIDHPNVIPVFSAGDQDGVAYLTMRFVEGDDVRSLVRRNGALAPTRAAHIVAQGASALDAIHAAGFVHRDVKPANVLLGPADHVYITDFGLAKHALSEAGHTRSGQWVGTLDYVSPEQIRGGAVDARADVYALGGVLHYMLTARPPYPREADEAKLWAHIADPPPRPSAAGAPVAFDAVVARAMAKAPEDRFPSAGDLGRAALAASGGAPVIEPERVVARGSAAPGAASPSTSLIEEPTIDGTAAVPRGMSVTRPVEPVARRAGGWRLPLAALAVLAAAALAAVLLLDRTGGPSEPSRDTDTVEPPAEPAGTMTTATIRRVGERPNGLALANDRLWITSFTSDRLRIVDRATHRVIGRPRVGQGASDIVVAESEVFVAATRDGFLTRLDARSGKVRDRIELTKPAAVAVTPRSVWVASRTAVRGAPDQLVQLDRQTLAELGRRPVDLGIAALTVTAETLWIAHRRQDKVSRLALDSGAMQLLRGSIGTGRLIDMAAGGGYVWVSTEQGVLARIQPRSDSVATIATGGRAGQLAIAAGRVWVALVDAGEVVAIDIRDSRRTGQNVPVGLNPFGIAADERAVFAASRGDATVTRIDLRGRGG